MGGWHGGRVVGGRGGGGGPRASCRCVYPRQNFITDSLFCAGHAILGNGNPVVVGVRQAGCAPRRLRAGQKLAAGPSCDEAAPGANVFPPGPQVGGHIAKSGYGNGLSAIRIFDSTRMELTTIAQMK